MALFRLSTTAFFCFVCVLYSPTLGAGDCVLSSSPAPFLLRLANCTFVDAWGLQVSVASPPQELCLGPSMVANNTIVFAPEICAHDIRAQCFSRRGGLFNIADATSAFTNISSPQGTLAPDDEWNSFNPPLTEAGNTTIQFSADISLSNFPVAIASNAPNSNLGQLGLANTSVLLRSMVSDGLAPVAGFGLFAGSQSVSNPQDGHIVIGGYDAARVGGPFSNYSISNATHPGSRICSLFIQVATLTLRRPNVPDIPIVSEGSPMSSCIEPYDNLFRLPDSEFESFMTYTNCFNDTSLISDQLYIVEPGLVCQSGFNGSLIFTLEGGLEVEIPNSELAQPVRGLDSNGKRVLQSNVTTVNVFNQYAPQKTASLGKVFLSRLYLTVDYSAQQFQLATLASGNEVAPNLISLKSSNAVTCPPDHSLTGSAIGAIVVGCALAIILIIVLWFYFFNWRPANMANEDRIRNAETRLANMRTSLERTRENVLRVNTSLEPANNRIIALDAYRPRGSIASELPTGPSLHGQSERALSAELPPGSPLSPTTTNTVTGRKENPVDEE